MTDFTVSIEQIQLKKDKIEFHIEIAEDLYKGNLLTFFLNDFDEIWQGTIISKKEEINTITVEFTLSKRFKHFKDGILKTILTTDEGESVCYNTIYSLEYTELYDDSIEKIEEYFSDANEIIEYIENEEFDEDEKSEEYEIFEPTIINSYRESKKKELSEYAYIYNFYDDINIDFYSETGVYVNINEFRKIGNDWLGICVIASNSSNKSRKILLSEISSGKNSSKYIGEVNSKKSEVFNCTWIQNLNFEKCPDVSFSIILVDDDEKEEYLGTLRICIDKENNRLGLDIISDDVHEKYIFEGKIKSKEIRELNGYDDSWFKFIPSKFELETGTKRNSKSDANDETFDFEVDFTIKSNLHANVLKDFEIYVVKPNGRKVLPWGYRTSVEETPNVIDIWVSDEDYSIRMNPVFEMKSVKQVTKNTRLCIAFKDTLKNYYIRKTYTFDEVWYDEEIVALPL